MTSEASLNKQGIMVSTARTLTMVCKLSCTEDVDDAELSGPELDVSSAEADEPEGGEGVGEVSTDEL